MGRVGWRGVRGILWVMYLEMEGMVVIQLLGLVMANSMMREDGSVLTDRRVSMGLEGGGRFLCF